MISRFCKSVENFLVFKSFCNRFNNLLDIGAVFSDGHGSDGRSQSSVKHADPVIESKTARAALEQVRAIGFAIFLRGDEVHDGKFTVDDLLANFKLNMEEFVTVGIRLWCFDNLNLRFNRLSQIEDC